MLRDKQKEQHESDSEEDSEEEPQPRPELRGVISLYPPADAYMQSYSQVNYPAFGMPRYGGTTIIYIYIYCS